MTPRLRGPGPIHGVWSTLGHPTVIELIGAAGPDFVCIDTQHGVDLSSLTTNIFSALSVFGVPGLVRVAANYPDKIGRALDLGAAGVMVPMVDTAEEAAKAVDACHHAPRGTRSLGTQTPRIDPLAGDYRPICAIQIETAAAVDNIGEIAAVDGIDWLYVGPADLGLSVGGAPASDVESVFSGNHPLSSEIMSSLKAVVAAARANSILAGLHCGSGRASRVAQAHGFLVSSVATDVTEMSSGLARQLEDARGKGKSIEPPAAG